MLFTLLCQEHFFRGIAKFIAIFFFWLFDYLFDFIVIPNDHLYSNETCGYVGSIVEARYGVRIGGTDLDISLSREPFTLLPHMERVLLVDHILGV